MFLILPTVAVEDDYRGPRWEEGRLDMEFMDHLLQWYSRGKLLHKKYAYKVSVGGRWGGKNSRE